MNPYDPGADEVLAALSFAGLDAMNAPVMRAVQRRLESGARPEDYTLRMFSVSLSGDEWGEGAAPIPRVSVEVNKIRPDILTAFARSGETTFAITGPNRCA